MVPSGLGAQRVASKRLTRRPRALGAAVAGVALVAAACGGGDNEVKAGGSSTSSSTSSSTTTSSTTTTTASPPVTVGIICSTPDDAAVALVEAWKSGDRAAAARCADASVVSTIFETDGAGAQWTFEGCGGPDPGVPQCLYRYEGGGVTLTLNGTEAAGWRVVTISFVAD